MSEQDQAPEGTKVTAAQLKAQIEEKQRELKQEGVEVPVSEPTPISSGSEPLASPDQASQANSVSLDKPTEAAATSAPAEATVPSNDDKVEDVPGIVKKKGWKDVDSFLKSYGELEKKLGERIPQEPASRPQQIPPQFHQPPVPRVNSAEIAHRYGLAPEDLERIAPLIADLSESIAEKKYRALEDRLASSERERQREREIERLKQDPHFQNPEVLSEMGLLLDRQPQLLKEENGLSYAFREALANVGRKRLEGSPPARTQPSGPVLPTIPPTTARGTGPTNVGRPGIAAPTTVTPANFSGLPLDEKMRVLKAIGARVDGD